MISPDEARKNGDQLNVRATSLAAELKDFLANDINDLEKPNLDFMSTIVEDLAHAFKTKRENLLKGQGGEEKREDPYIGQEEERRREKPISGTGARKKETLRNKPNVRYDLKYRSENSEESDSSAFESKSGSNSESSVVKRKNRKRSKRKRAQTRKYTIDESSASAIDSEEDGEFGKGGKMWLKRLVELEKSGMETGMAVNRIFIVLAGELLEVLRTFSKANVKAVKPLIYGIEKVQTFDAFIEDYERYAREQLGRDKNRWAVELRNFLEGPPLRSYYSIYRAKMNYSTIVTRLRSRCKEEKESEILDLQREFWRIEMRKNERYSEFALRLQTTYEAATPSDQRDVDVLKKQFVKCLPKKVARRFKLRMGTEKEGTRIRWKDVLNWAQEEDELDDQENDEQKDDAIPIWATLQDDGNQQVTYADRVRYRGPPKVGNSEYRRYDHRDNRIHAGRNKICHHCQREGHIKRDCWRFKGWCLVCGSNEHRIANCDMRNMNRNRQKESAPRTEGEQNRATPRTYRVEDRKCFFCEQTGHLWEACPWKSELNELMQKKQQPMSGNEVAPPFPGVCRSQQQ